MYDNKILNCFSHLCLVASLTCCLTVGPASAALNVRDFGAKGDDVSDDTEAIRATFEAAQKQYKLGETASDLPGWGYYPTRPEIVFPAGRYRISSAIYISQGVIRGEGEACIIQTQKDQDIFTSDGAWRLTVSGLTFVGGRNQLQLRNLNADKGFVLINECRFYAAAGVAVIMDKGSASTQLKIRDCVFVEPEQALVCHNDETNVTDCWITSARKMENKAVIEARGGRMVLEKILGVPLANGTDQRWIDLQWGDLTCREFRFGGEFGGFTPIVNFAKCFTTELSCGLGPTILLDNCKVFAGANKKRQCAVYLEEIPNRITIRNCKLGAPALKFSKHIDLKTYFKGTTPGLLSFELENNLRNKGVAELPGLLKHPVIEGNRVIAEISPAETAKALEAAQLEVKQLAESPSASGLSFSEHRQQDQQGKFVEIGYSPSNWRLDDLGGTDAKNSEYLAVVPVGNDVLIMRRTSRSMGEWSARNDRPHVLIKDVDIDLDRYPLLTWKLREAGMPSTYAVEVLDKESDETQMLVESGEPWTEYRAYDLRELFELTGVRTFDIKFYFSQTSHLRQDWENRLQAVGKPGDYILLDFIRTEAE